MEQQAPAPEPTSVPTSEQLRVMADDKKRFVEEEYDFISRELAAWLSGLAGKEVNENLVDSLADGTILCCLVRDCLPSVEMKPFHDSVERTSFYAKDNIAVFTEACIALGMDANDCVTPAMFEQGDRKSIVHSLLRFALAGMKQGLKPLSLFESDRYKDFATTMPEEALPMADSVVAAKKTEEEEPHEWTIHDDIVIWTILAIMFSAFAGVVYIAFVLMSHLKERDRKSVV